MLWWMIAAVCAFFVKGLCGFGNTLAFTAILGFSNDNVSISPVDLLLGYPANMILAIKERRSVKWNVCLMLIALVLAGAVPGAFFLKNADATVVKLISGAAITLIGVEMLMRELRPKKLKQSKLALAAVGLISGVLCGLFGIGALLGAYVSRITGDSREFRGTLCTVFFAENTFRIILYAAWGIIRRDTLLRSLTLAPFMLLGLGLGMLAAKVLPERAARLVIIAVLMVSGVALIITTVW